MTWPAIPERRAALLLALLYQFRDTECLAPHDLEERQLDALSRLLAHAWRTVPHYRDRSSYAVLAARNAPTSKEWRSLPVLTRADVQEAGTSLRSDNVPSSHLPVTEVVTTGSTGRPVRAMGTAITDVLWRAITVREHLWHGRDVTGKLAAVRADLGNKVPAEGLMLSGWGPATAAVFPTGPCALLSIRRDVDSQVAWLLEQDPDYLITYPSNLVALAHQFRREGKRLSRLRGACTYGETLSRQVRPLCQGALGVEVVDVYSAQELGYLALQCPHSQRYHVQSESVYVEVLDDRGEPCLPGEIGRVVVTALHNYATPLLRYDVGDYAEMGSPCGCGRGLPVINRILGRERNMWALPDGRTVWPIFSSKDWGHIDAIRQLQLVQHDLERIEARVVGPRPLRAEEEAEVIQLMRKEFDHPFSVRFSYVHQIERKASRKFEDFVSLVPRTDGAATWSKGLSG